MSYFDEKEIIEVPLERIGEDGQSSTRYCFTEMTARLRIPLTEAVKKYNEIFPEDATSQPNFANKLRRGGLKDYELARYAYALGYKLVIVPSESEPQPIVKAQTDNFQLSLFEFTDDGVKVKDMTFEKMLRYGFESVSTPNFLNVLIAGEKAPEAAAYIEKLKEKGRLTTQLEELMLFAHLEKELKIKIKPISGE